jgi:excinuclease ABC subunit A
VARNGRPARWDGRILDIIADRVETLGQGQFAPVDWSQRGVVRITSADKTANIAFPFFHATTSGEWVVTLRFFVPRNTFKERTLEVLLKLVPFHDSPIPVLSDAPRISFTNIASTQEITITGHAVAEFETKGFETFLVQAVASCLGQGKSGKAKLRNASEM